MNQLVDIAEMIRTDLEDGVRNPERDWEWLARNEEAYQKWVVF